MSEVPQKRKPDFPVQMKTLDDQFFFKFPRHGKSLNTAIKGFGARWDSEQKLWYCHKDVAGHIWNVLQEYFEDHKPVEYEGELTMPKWKAKPKHPENMPEKPPNQGIKKQPDNKPVRKQATKKQTEAKPKNDDFDMLRRNGFIINLKGKEYITFPGLLVLAHQNGLEKMNAEVTFHDPENKMVFYRATVSGKRGSFVAHGDAAPDNLSRNMVPSYYRMGETRSYCRSLRLYLGIGMTAIEELPGN